MTILDDQSSLFESSVYRITHDSGNKLDDVMVETILAMLPTADIFHCQFVCKRWKLIIHNSPTFSIVRKQIFGFRQNPWFIMFKSINSISRISTGVVYDMEIGYWRHIQLPLPITHSIIGKRVSPVTSSSGLVLFKTGTMYYYSFIVCNPLTGFSKSLPKVELHGDCRAIAMHTSRRISESRTTSNNNNYTVFVICGNWPNLVMKVYSSDEETWMDNEFPLSKSPIIGALSWSHVFKFSTVISAGNEGQIMVNCLNQRSGKLIRFDTQKRTFSMNPTGLITLHYEEDIMELVECGGKVLVVVLRPVFSIDYLRVRSWKLMIWELEYCHQQVFTAASWKWNLLSTMFEEYNKVEQVDTIKCSGGNGGYIMICLNSTRTNFNKVVMYNMNNNTWDVLPPCSDCHNHCDLIPLTSVYSIMPDFQTKV